MCNDICPDKALVWCDFDDKVLFTPSDYITNTETSQTGKLPLYGVSNYGRNPLSPKYLQLGGGINILVDGNMEAADASAYFASNFAVLSKENDSRFVKCLRINRSTNAFPNALQTILTQNKTYRARGYARGSGLNVQASVLLGESGKVIVCNSNEWTYFDFTKLIPTTGVYVQLFGENLSAGQYVEFAQVSVEEVTADTTYPTLLPSGNGVSWSTSVNSSRRVTTGIDLFQNNFTIFMHLNDVYIGANFPSFLNDGTNIIYSFANSLLYSHNGGSSSNVICQLPFDKSNITATVAVSRNGTAIIGYNNGNQTSSFNPGIKTSGTYNTIIGNSSTFNRGFAGNMLHLSVFPYVLSTNEIKLLHNQSLKRLNIL